MSGGKFVCGEQIWTKEELVRAVKAEPEKFSPNALLRPVLQDFLLPTAAYIAGPAEIAYFAQAEVIYRKLLGRMTVILPRSAYTILDAKAEKLLRRYGLKVEDVWRGSQELRSKMETSSVPTALGRNFDKSVKESAKMLAQLKKQIVRLDPTLSGAVETAQKKIAFQLEKLKRKTGKAQALKAGLIAAHEESLESLLYPHKTSEISDLESLRKGWMNDANLNSSNGADEQEVENAARGDRRRRFWWSGCGQSAWESAGRSHSHRSNEPFCFCAASLSGSDLSPRAVADEFATPRGIAKT